MKFVKLVIIILMQMKNVGYVKPCSEFMTKIDFELGTS